MVRISNNCIGCLNLITFLLSLPIFAAAIWVATHSSSGCGKLMNGRAIYSGCCKPPAECGLIYQKPTVWTEPKGGFTSDNPDCKTWSNNNSTLCYDCNSCKAGVIANTTMYWKVSAIVNAVFIAILIVVYAIGCCALKNNKEDNALPRLKGFV